VAGHRRDWGQLKEGARQMRVLAEDGYEKRPRAAPKIQRPAVLAEVILRGQCLGGSGR
jgi:hypothetical protein